MMKMEKNSMYFIGGAVLTAAASYGIYRLLTREMIPHQVRHKLPIAKNLPTIADHEGNYDLDGVSFDIEGVIISGDSLKPTFIPI